MFRNRPSYSSVFLHPRLKLYVSLFAFVLETIACKSSTTHCTDISGLLSSGEWTNSIATQNEKIIRQQYKDEWQYNRYGHHDAPPCFGLALSGGGIRSGIFSIGVLQGLKEIGVLDDIDVISSVSGGGYAASWFYIQSLENDFKSEPLFENSGKYKEYLANHGELVSHFAANLNEFRWSEYGINGIETAVSWPINLIANGLFGWHLNVVPLRRIYQKGIDRVYHVVPNREGRRSPLDFLGFCDCSTFLNAPKHVRFEQLATEIKGWLPFPIVNTTAHIEDASAEEVGLLKFRVFEFTPLHYGSDYFGYQPNNFPIDYNRAISVSGAAVDSKMLRESNQRLIASAFNCDLGYFINNPNANTSGRALRRLLPLPLYLFSGHYQRDFKGDRIYLADGGHSENLGAYSLVRRLCQYIIIVDAEYDPCFQFESYKLLKQALRKEMGVDFHVDTIDQAIYHGNFSGEMPVMTGTISYFPVKNDDTNTIENRVIHVVYIKLSIDKQKLSGNEGYGHEIKDFYAKHENFPQQTTTDQSYTPDQVVAYRELGCFIVQTHKAEIRNALGL
jgi:hypothetical protein